MMAESGKVNRGGRMRKEAGVAIRHPRSCDLRDGDDAADGAHEAPVIALPAVPALPPAADSVLPPAVAQRVARGGGGREETESAGLGRGRGPKGGPEGAGAESGGVCG